jgi:hypothetical protein
MCNQENERQDARGTDDRESPDASTRQRFRAPLDKGPVNGRPLTRAMSAARLFLVVDLFLSVAIASPEAKALEATRAVAIQTVLTAVRDALIGVQKTLRHDNYPPLSAVTLTLQTTVAKQAGGEVKLLVVVIGGKAEKQELQEIVIQLTPPSPNTPRNVAEESLTSALESAIVSAVEGAQNAGSPGLPLAFTGLQVSISFVVKSNAGGGAKIEILPISADLSGEVSESSIQSIKVVFGALK